MHRFYYACRLFFPVFLLSMVLLHGPAYSLTAKSFIVVSEHGLEALPTVFTGSLFAAWPWKPSEFRLADHVRC